MAQKIPEIVLKLQQLAKPTFVNQRWRKAAISGRKIAGIRKAMVASGVYWPPKPLRDRSKDKPFKLIKHERTREERKDEESFIDRCRQYRAQREKKIEENMKNMPKMVEEHREKMKAIRRAAREKKQGTEEKRYLLATGKTKEVPEWKKLADEQLKKAGKKK